MKALAFKTQNIRGSSTTSQLPAIWRGCLTQSVWIHSDEKLKQVPWSSLFLWGFVCLFDWSTLQYMHTCTVGFWAGEAPRKKITMRIYTDGSFSVCSGVKGKEGWGWGSTCCGPGNIRMRMFELVPACCPAFLWSENGWALPHLSPDWTAHQNFRSSGTSFWRGAGAQTCRIGASSKTGQNVQNQKGKQHIYPSDIHKFHLIGSCIGPNPEWDSTPMPSAAELITICQDAPGVVWKWHTGFSRGHKHL